MQTFNGAYHYYINSDERGEFFADVRDKYDDTEYEILNIDHLNELIDFKPVLERIEYLLK